MRTILTVSEEELGENPFRRRYRFEYEGGFCQITVPEHAIQSMYSCYPNDGKKGLVMATEYFLQMLGLNYGYRDSLHEGDREE
jgi:hypothetical protein